MKKTICIFVSMLLFVTAIAVTGTEIKNTAPSSIQPGIEWDQTFGGSNMDWGNCVQQTADGGYVVAGTYDRQYWYPWNSFFYLLKTDADATEEWSYLYGGDMTYEFCCVQQTDDDGDGDKDDGYVTTGYAGYAASYVLILGKSDASGIEEWSQTFGTMDGYHAGYGVQQTSDGGYIVAGETTYGAGMSDIWLIKTDADGNEEWNKTFGGSESDKIQWRSNRPVQQTSDGGYIIIGTTESYATSGSDVWLIKTDADGIEEWSQTFEKDDNDAEGGYSVQQTDDDGYIITGYTGSWMEDDIDVYLIKTDASGTEEWSQTFGGSNYDEGHSVQQTTDGGYIVAGYYTDPDTWDADVYVIKTDASGTEEWSQTIDKNEDDRAFCIQQTSDEGYIITGYTGSWGMPADVDVWLIKLEGVGQPYLNCEGELSWTEIKPGDTVTGEFEVENIGDPGSELDWEIESYPDWGEWTFDPDSGNDLTPEDGSVIIQVEVIAPEDPETEFEGEIKVVNSEDPDDFCIIEVSLATPKCMASPFLRFLQRLTELFPNALPILKLLLGL